MIEDIQSVVTQASGKILFGQNVRIGAQGCREAVDVGIGPFFDIFVLAVGRPFRCRHLVGEMGLAERGEGAGLIGFGVGIIRDIVFQVNKDHHDAM